VVTRYFGGTLLGTGGLVRAYTEAAKSALESANIITKVLQQLISVQVAYTLVGKLEYYIHQSNIEQYNVQYDEHVTYDILVNISQVEACMKDIRELTANRFSGDYKDIYYTYQLDGKLYLDTKVGD
jgi:putative IMPACT (imprinted ancient) family translation regulator